MVINIKNALYILALLFVAAVLILLVVSRQKEIIVLTNQADDAGSAAEPAELDRLQAAEAGLEYLNAHPDDIDPSPTKFKKAIEGLEMLRAIQAEQASTALEVLQ